MITDNLIPIEKHIEHLKNMQCLDHDSRIKGLVYRWGKPFRHGDPYPEITGYFMTSFSRMYDLTKDDDFLERAKNAADCLIFFQKENGTIPTVINKKGSADNISHFFDLAIIARGFFDVYERSNDDKYLNAGKIVCECLINLSVNLDLPSVVDLDLNKVTNEGFPEPFWINTKAIIPFSMLYKYQKNDQLLEVSKKIAELLMHYQQSDGGYRMNENSPYNRTHYHAYAAYGVSYLYIWTKDQLYFDSVKKATDWLIACTDTNGAVFTSCTADGRVLKGNGYDVPVSAQLAELCLFVEKYSSNDLDIEIYKSMRKKCERFIASMTIESSFFKYLDGGLPFMVKKDSGLFSVPWGELFSINYYYDKNWKCDE